MNETIEEVKYNKYIYRLGVYEIILRTKNDIFLEYEIYGDGIDKYIYSEDNLNLFELIAQIYPKFKDNKPKKQDLDIMCDNCGGDGSVYDSGENIDYRCAKCDGEGYNKNAISF